jgi:hypothetical protein
MQITFWKASVRIIETSHFWTLGIISQEPNTKNDNPNPTPKNCLQIAPFWQVQTSNQQHANVPWSSQKMNSQLLPIESATAAEHCLKCRTKWKLHHSFLLGSLSLSGRANKIWPSLESIWNPIDLCTWNVVEFHVWHILLWHLNWQIYTLSSDLGLLIPKP